MQALTSFGQKISGLSPYYSHPDIQYEKGIGYIDDLREHYLPAASFGSVYLPLGKPVIATMPGLEEASPNCYNFFVQREIYLINSKRFCYGAVLSVAFIATSIFISIWFSSLVTITAATIALLALHELSRMLIHRYFEGKADDEILKTASSGERSAVLGLIETLQVKGEHDPDIRPFEGLRLKLAALEVKPTPFPSNGFDAHDERKSSLGLDYTMRPGEYQLGQGSIADLFYKREDYHKGIDDSQWIKIAGGIGIFAVTAALMPGILASKMLALPFGLLAFYVYYKAAHLVGDIAFQKIHDPQSILQPTIDNYPNIYRGAYWKSWGQGVSSSPSLA